MKNLKIKPLLFLPGLRIIMLADNTLSFLLSSQSPSLSISTFSHSSPLCSPHSLSNRWECWSVSQTSRLSSKARLSGYVGGVCFRNMSHSPYKETPLPYKCIKSPYKERWLINELSVHITTLDYLGDWGSSNMSWLCFDSVCLSSRRAMRRQVLFNINDCRQPAKSPAPRSARTFLIMFQRAQNFPLSPFYNQKRI